MKLLNGIEQAGNWRGGYVSIGNFDGVHRGHQRMIAALVQRARTDQVPAVVLTFDPHPIAILSPERTPPSLSTLARKAELLEQCGVDAVIAYPTSESLLGLSPEQFFEQIVVGGLDARGLVEGPNFCFGRDRAGTVQTLRSLCERSGLTLDVIDAVMWEGQVVSSSAVRLAIRQGRLAEAVKMLGHPYRLTGQVTTGARRGQLLGLPTANLAGIVTLLPADGVYAGRVVVDERSYRAAVHIGVNPTFGEHDHKIEVHLLDFEGNLYESVLSVDLIDRIRGTMSFPDPKALQAQIIADLNEVRRLVLLDSPGN